MGILAGKKGLIMGLRMSDLPRGVLPKRRPRKGLNLPLPIRLKALKNGWSHWQHQSDQIS